MVILRMSTLFTQSANQLPKEAKVKLTKTFMLLTNNPRHPSLQLKKIEGAIRKNVYECRLDQFWLIILQEVGEMTFDLVYVGAHDEAIRYGAGVREATAHYSSDLPLDRVNSYLAGNEQALEFVKVSQSDLEMLGD